jgi:hypothetical protein
MTYFRELPDIQYQNFFDTNVSATDYVTIKNIFLRGKLRDDLQNVFTVFDKYEISERERPDQIAEKLYGDASLDWIVRIVANIINYQNDLPLNSQQLYDYVVNKYGQDGVSEIRFYQSIEIKDSTGRLIQPEGVVVDEDFSITFFDEGLNTYVTRSGLGARDGVTNFEYESNLNDEKKTIFVLKPEYINLFIQDMRDIATYGFNSEFINNRTIRTENTRITSP